MFEICEALLWCVYGSPRKAMQMPRRWTNIGPFEMGNFELLIVSHGVAVTFDDGSTLASKFETRW